MHERCGGKANTRRSPKPEAGGAARGLLVLGVDPLLFVRGKWTATVGADDLFVLIGRDWDEEDERTVGTDHSDHSAQTFGGRADASWRGTLRWMSGSVDR